MPEKSDELKNSDTATDDVVIADSKAEEGENVSETEVLLETTGSGSDFEIEEVQSEVSDLASLSMVSLSSIYTGILTPENVDFQADSVDGSLDSEVLQSVLHSFDDNVASHVSEDIETVQESSSDKPKSAEENQEIDRIDELLRTLDHMVSSMEDCPNPYENEKKFVDQITQGGLNPGFWSNVAKRCHL